MIYKHKDNHSKDIIFTFFLVFVKFYPNEYFFPINTQVVSTK